MGGDEYLSFLQPVVEGGGGRESGGEVMAPIVLLVHVRPEVAEIWEAFPGEAFLRGRGCCGLGREVSVGKVLDGFKEIDQGWDVGCGEFYESILEEVPESVSVRAGIFGGWDGLRDGVGGFLSGCFVVVDVGLESLGFVEEAAIFCYSIWGNFFFEPCVGHSGLMTILVEARHWFQLKVQIR